MPTQPSPSEHIPTEYLARAIAAAALVAIAVIHVIDLPDTLDETPLIGAGYFLVIATALVGAAVMISVPGPRAWLLADLIATAAMGAYVLSRTTGLPSDPLDVGNWNCALGIAALSSESLIVLLALWRMWPRLPVHEAHEAHEARRAGATATRASATPRPSRRRPIQSAERVAYRTPHPFRSST